jgi:hypothetical protein
VSREDWSARYRQCLDSCTWSALMTIPGQFPPRMPRAVSATAAPPAGAPVDATAGPPPATTPGSWPWRRAALLLAVAPAPLAAVAAFAPTRVARVAVVAAAAVVVAGIAGQVTHTGLFFVPALAGLAGAAVRLWREEP